MALPPISAFIALVWSSILAEKKTLTVNADAVLRDSIQNTAEKLQVTEQAVWAEIETMFRERRRVLQLESKKMLRRARSLNVFAR